MLHLENLACRLRTSCDSYLRYRPMISLGGIVADELQAWDTKLLFDLN
jgi:hypothetical protein